MSSIFWALGVLILLSESTLQSADAVNTKVSKKHADTGASGTAVQENRPGTGEANQIPDLMLSETNLLIQRMLELDVECHAGTFSITWLLMATDCADGNDCSKQCSQSADQMQRQMVEDKLLFNANPRRFRCVAYPDAEIQVGPAIYQPGFPSATQGRSSSLQCQCSAKLVISEIINVPLLRAKINKRGPPFDRADTAFKGLKDCSMGKIQEHLLKSFSNLKTAEPKFGGPLTTKNNCRKFREQNTRLPGFGEVFKARAHLPQVQNERRRARYKDKKCKKASTARNGFAEETSSKRNRCDDLGEDKERDDIAGVCQSQQQPSTCQVQQPPPQQDFCSPSEQRPKRQLPDLNFLHKFDVDWNMLLPEDDTTED
jgi:hypothetical protein